MAQRYPESELKQIGKQCGNRLPPASAMQAMFLYEMQRETECEKLFQGSMFRLAKAEAYSSSLEKRMSELEQQLKAVQKQVTAKDVDERVATSKAHIDSLRVTSNTHTKRLDSHAQRLTTAEERFDGIDAVINTTRLDVNRLSLDVKGMGKQPSMLSKTSNAPRHGIDDLDEDISILFDERDALASQLNEANERTAILEAQVVERIAKVEHEATERVAQVEQKANEHIAKLETELRSYIARGQSEMVHDLAKVKDETSLRMKAIEMAREGQDRKFQQQQSLKTGEAKRCPRSTSTSTVRCSNWQTESG